MAIWGKLEKQPVARVEVSFLDGKRATVTHWVAEGDRESVAYHTILLFMMHYSRLLYFLSYRPSADQLVGWMEAAVLGLAEAEADQPVSVSQDWSIVEADGSEPRTTWAAELAMLAPKKYRVYPKRPHDPEDEDAQGVALLHLQLLVDTLAPLERAHLALGIAGMHDYYRTIKHWGNSKTLHAAVMHGMAYAQRTLRGK